LSIELITKVRTRLDVSGGELLVAVELVDAANDSGEGIFVGVHRIAKRSRQDPRMVQRQLKHLIETGWLEVVRRGGGRRADGRGIPTAYRVNPAWVKGDKLPGFPDYECPFEEEPNGDNLSPLGESYGDKKGGSTVTKTPDNGDTAMSGDPLTRLPKDACAREQRPSGSRATAKDEPLQFDADARRTYWRSTAIAFCESDAWLFEVVPRGVNFANFPPAIRDGLPERMRPSVDWAVDREFAGTPMREISDQVQREVSRLIRDLMPPSQSQRAAVAQVAS
jgi:hypothetical protein